MTVPTSPAHDLDRRIREGWQSLATSIASVQELIAQARSGEVWRELGFASWTAYVADVTSAQPVRLEREQRRELVALLTAEGMSNRAIGVALGVDERSVRRDHSGAACAAPAERIDVTTGEVLPAPVDLHDWRRQQLATAEAKGKIVRLADPDSIATPPKVTGLDGKTYTRPAAKPKVIDDAESVEFAKDYCAGIAKAVTSLAPAQHANMRAAWIKYWAAGSLGASPAQRDFMTATNLRLIGAGLIELADEWETR